MSTLQNKLDKVHVLSTLVVNETNQRMAEKLLNEGYIEGYLICAFNGVENELFVTNLKGLTSKGKSYLKRLKGEIKLLTAGIELA